MEDVQEDVVLVQGIMEDVHPLKEFFSKKNFSQGLYVYHDSMHQTTSACASSMIPCAKLQNSNGLLEILMPKHTLEASEGLAS